MKSNRPLVAILILLAFCQASYSQEDASVLGKIASFPSRFFDKLQQKSADLEDKIIANSEKALKKLARQEARLKKKLAKKDSLQAEQLFGNVEEKYQQMQQQLLEPEKLVSRSREYLLKINIK